MFTISHGELANRNDRSGPIADFRRMAQTRVVWGPRNAFHHSDSFRRLLSLLHRPVSSRSEISTRSRRAASGRVGGNLAEVFLH